MPIEAATYISQLNASYPDGGDAKSTLDNHDRLVKAVLLASLPNISGAMNASHTELNVLVGITTSSTLGAQLAAKASLAGATFTGLVTFSAAAAFSATATFSGAVSVPAGAFPGTALADLFITQMTTATPALGDLFVFADTSASGVKRAGTIQQIVDLVTVTGNVTHKVITDSTDITLADIASSYSTFGASFALTIPASGTLLANLTGRLRSDYAGTSTCYIGLRISGVNYWFGTYTSVVGGAGATTSYFRAMYSGVSSTNDYTETYGADGSPSDVPGMSIEAMVAKYTMPTGAQTVQFVVARDASGAASLRGTTTPSRAHLIMTEAA